MCSRTTHPHLQTDARRKSVSPTKKKVEAKSDRSRSPKDLSDHSMHKSEAEELPKVITLPTGTYQQEVRWVPVKTNDQSPQASLFDPPNGQLSAPQTPA
jgi:hypothetical protein